MHGCYSHYVRRVILFQPGEAIFIDLSYQWKLLFDLSVSCNNLNQHKLC